MGVAIGFVLVAGGLPAAAGVVLDQSVVISHDPKDDAFHDIDSAADWAQTFTVGLGGTLTAVGLEVWADRPLTHSLRVDIRPTVNRVPLESNTAPLASATLAPSALPVLPPVDGFIPMFTMVDFSAADVPVTPGEVLALVLRSDEPNGPPGHEYLWSSTHQFVSIYPGGQFASPVCWQDLGKACPRVCGGPGSRIPDVCGRARAVLPLAAHRRRGGAAAMATAVVVGRLTSSLRTRCPGHGRSY